MERWRPIPDARGYEVSNLGRVRSKDRVVVTSRGPRSVKGRVLKATPNTDGYLMVNVGGRNQTVHRLVLAAFVGPCPDGQEARHLNGNRADNRLANLAWGTRAQNEADRERHGGVLFGVRHPNTRLTPADDRDILLQYEQGTPQRVLAARYGVGQATISRALRRAREHRQLR